MIMLAKKVVSSILSCAITLLPLTSWATPNQSGIYINNIPANSQPQIMIILDNSQGMAGVVKDPNTGLSGAIMTGSGVVAENSSSSSPVNYQSGAVAPIAYGTSDASVPYTVTCAQPGLTAPAQSTCASIENFGYQASNIYVDNSPSMLNAAKQAVNGILQNPNYSNNIQFGLEDYAYSGSLNDLYSSVYYMLENGFSSSVFASQTPNGTLGVNYVINPCWNNNSNSCQLIASQLGYVQYKYRGQIYGVPYTSSPSYLDRYLLISDSSDNPRINSVVYSSAYAGNNVYYNYSGTYNYGPNNLANYETQLLGTNYPPYSQYNASTAFYGYTKFGPSNPGYLTQTPAVWAAARGYAFFGTPVTTQGSNSLQGNILAPVAPFTQSGATLQQQIQPAPLLNPSSGFNYNSTGVPIEAGNGHAPVAGAFQTALNYFSSAASSYAEQSTPEKTCGNRYVIFITNGQPTQGLNGHLYPPLGSQAATTFGFPTDLTASTVSTSTDPNKAVVEAVSTIAALKSAGIKTYVLGVGSAVNPSASGSTNDNQEAVLGQAVLTAMAQAGGTGYYYSATSTSEIGDAFSSIIANIVNNTVTSPIAATATVTNNSLEFVLENIDKGAGKGNMYAYPFSSSGVTATATSQAAWDANSVVSASIASGSPPIYTTAATGSSGSLLSGGVVSLTSLAATDPSAYGSNLPAGLSPSIIANYATDPASLANSAYLGGRAANWYIGLPTSSTPLIVTPPNNGLLLSSGGGGNSYTTFANNHSTRENSVVFSANNGFLYSIGYNSTTGKSPALLWAWIPHGLINQLQNYNTFWRGQSMEGGFQDVDATDANGKWHTYIVGSALGGGILYDLELSGDNSPELSKVVMENDLGLSYFQPLPQSPVIYQVTSGNQFGQTWALWVINQYGNSSVNSYLAGVNVGTGQYFQDKLPFVASSSLSINSGNTLYLGTSSGYVYQMAAAQVPQISGASSAASYNISGQLATPVITSAGFSGNSSSSSSGAVTYAPWATPSSGLSAAVQYVNFSVYLGVQYLTVQGPSGFTVFSSTTGGVSWQALWAAYSGGSAVYSSSGTTPSITGLPSNSSGQSSAVSAPIAINNGAIIVPVTVSPPVDSCGESLAYYYFYTLTNGSFPSGVFEDSNNVGIVSRLLVGYGTAYTPTFMSFNGRTLIQSAAGNPGTGGQFPAFYQNGSSVRVVGWRVLY